MDDCGDVLKPSIRCRSWASVGCVIDGMRLGKCWSTSPPWGSGMEEDDDDKEEGLVVVLFVPSPWTVGVGLSCGEEGSAFLEEGSVHG